jgi:hypothetical protein
MRKTPLILAAESEESCDNWIKAIQLAIQIGLSNVKLAEELDKPENFKTDQETSFEILRKIPGNLVCADCSSENPEWANISIGSLICIECSGVHRGLGNEMATKVRSCILDAWTLDTLKFMQLHGNLKVNELYEHNLQVLGMKKPSFRDDPATRKKFIDAKYVAKRFCK